MQALANEVAEAEQSMPGVEQERMPFLMASNPSLIKRRSPPALAP